MHLKGGFKRVPSLPYVDAPMRSKGMFRGICTKDLREA